MNDGVESIMMSVDTCYSVELSVTIVLCGTACRLGGLGGSEGHPGPTFDVVH